MHLLNHVRRHHSGKWVVHAKAQQTDPKRGLTSTLRVQDTMVTQHTTDSVSGKVLQARCLDAARMPSNAKLEHTIDTGVALDIHDAKEVR